jgi:hypothetical protein
LTLSGAKGSCIAWATLKMASPKKICGCPFLWFVSFGQAKEMNIKDLDEQKEMNKIKKEGVLLRHPLQYIN